MMKKLVKKIVVLSMVGVIQIGFGASAIEASPLHNASVTMLDNRHHDRYEREHKRHERERIENERHEHAMERRHHESYHEWRERQHYENRRHDENMRRIAHDILELILD